MLDFCNTMAATTFASAPLSAVRDDVRVGEFGESQFLPSPFIFPFLNYFTLPFPSPF